MVNIIWSQKSIFRINEIVSYLEDVSGSEETARDFVRSMYDATRRLVKFPFSGRIVPEYEDPNIREIIFKKYRIIYSFKDSNVEILTVEHTSRILRL